MPRILFLHIGAGKTGTSALQTGFALNARILRKYGVRYPLSQDDETNATNGMVTSGNGRPLVKYLVPQPKGSRGDQRYLDLLERRLSIYAPRHVLYSSEMMQRFQPEELDRLAYSARRQKYFTQIIYYVRSIGSHCYSVYNQAVKRRQYAGTLQEFIEAEYSNFFAETLNKAARVVKRANVIVRNYDTARGDLLGDFFDNVLRLQLSERDREHLEQPSTINRSLSMRETEILRLLNGHFKSRNQSKWVSNYFIYNSDEPPSAPIVLTPAEADALENRFAIKVQQINSYLRPGEQPIEVIGPGVSVGERAMIGLDESVRRRLVELSAAIPDVRKPEPNEAAERACQEIAQIATAA